MLLQIIGIRTIFILFFDIYKEKVKQKTKNENTHISSWYSYCGWDGEGGSKFQEQAAGNKALSYLRLSSPILSQPTEQKAI